MSSVFRSIYETKITRFCNIEEFCSHVFQRLEPRRLCHNENNYENINEK